MNLTILICEEIAYNKGRISINHLWEFASTLVPIGDESIKNFVFACLTSTDDIIIYRNGQEISKERFDHVPDSENELSIGITEDKLWLMLTGYNKKECTIGNAAFEILLEIAKAKEAGINTKDVARETGQDPRSITGRVKKLGNLINSVQMIYKGHVVKLLKLKKFSISQNDAKSYISIKESLPKIIEVVKNSKNGIRQIVDLKRELKFDQDPRTSKSFLSTLAWLDEKNYLKKVFVVSPTNPSVKIRCVKFLKDYVPNEKLNENFDIDSDTSDEESGNGDQTGMEDDEIFDELDSSNANNLLQGQELVMEENPNVGKDQPLLNRFFPIQNQTYALASQSGTSGVSTMEAVSKITGKDYKRGFSKASEYYISNIGKQKQKNKSMSKIVRVYDFEGKKNFIESLQEKCLNQLAGSETIEPEDFPPMKYQMKTLSNLNKANFTPLSNTLRFTTQNGKDIFFWHGELNIKPKLYAPMRGRKRKQTTDIQPHDSVKDTSTESCMPKKIDLDKNSIKKQKISDEMLVQDLKNEVETLNKTINGVDDTKSTKTQKPLNVGGFTGGSLRSLWSQRAIADVIRNTGGVTYLREQFYEAISKELGSKTTLDKKTVRGDVDLMVKNGKLVLKIEPVSGRRIVYLPDIEPDVISDYVLKEKDNKKVYSNDILHNTDIYFFDQTEKDRFHRGMKSVERIRKFQSKSRTKTNKNKNAPSNTEAETSAVRRTTRSKAKRSQNTTDNPTTLATEKKKKKKEKSKNKDTNTTFHLGNKRGIRILIMAVVITKSIKNEIIWDKITRLFPNNSLENLKKQWTIRRVRMGHSGWKAYVDKWRKILVTAVKKGRASLDDAESLDLPKLVNLWLHYNHSQQNKPIILYNDYEENRKRYTLVRTSKDHDIKLGLAMSSMVQRETSLLKKSYMCNKDVYVEEPDEKLLLEDNAKSVIRSILYENPITPREKVDALNEFSKESLDKVILDLAKEKQIYLRGSKLESTSIFKDLLESKGNIKPFQDVEKIRSKLYEMMQAENGVLISNEFSDILSWILIDIIARRNVHMDAIPIPRKIPLFNYTTRKFDVKQLTPAIIVSAKHLGSNIWNIKNITIPSGQPYSRIWIDGTGSIRSSVWNHVCSLLINVILFNPGINIKTLHTRCHRLLSNREIEDIVKWLVDKYLLIPIDCGGYKASNQWYTLLA
ncbi:hypothetical protein TBLA_0E01310 [Henningerozyma blattae CBS 6284]|uniref:Uncharacterized protein n=1 Tax=Henningerozyma blattae (strain ATCC 34711 / CBS 6284 / DSM 70876 / NBRC 10599 / NRRL Y-10934 / UCD 77-7) TaxID=1071380 RepID=I2H489_HENB6|nr:hypothetical protein TBLA_0E01310 [Tetrapisispora blattae CBS 6284]CCH61191.1 hypothetical protein TBLA_0E01310 [Tetrapisispora blattae CBS 6284]